MQHDDLPCPADPTGHSSSTTTRARGAFDTTGGEEAERNFGFAAVADSSAEIRHCLSGEQLAIWEAYSEHLAAGQQGFGGDEEECRLWASFSQNWLHARWADDGLRCSSGQCGWARTSLRCNRGEGALTVVLQCDVGGWCAFSWTQWPIQHCGF